MFVCSRDAEKERKDAAEGRWWRERREEGCGWRVKGSEEEGGGRGPGRNGRNEEAEEWNEREEEERNE